MKAAALFPNTFSVAQAARALRVRCARMSGRTESHAQLEMAGPARNLTPILDHWRNLPLTKNNKEITCLDT